MNMARNNNILKAFVKSVKDTEISSVFLSEVKISASGLKNIQEKQKQALKAKQKQKWMEQQNLQKNKTKIDLSNIHPKKRNKIKK